jgi:hypothetical protein
VAADISSPTCHQNRHVCIPCFIFFREHQNGFFLSDFVIKRPRKAFAAGMFGDVVRGGFQVFLQFYRTAGFGTKPPFAAPYSGRVDKAFTASQSRCMNNFAFQAMTMGMTTTLCGGGVGL